MPVDVRIISIGTLSAHPLWLESAPVRTGHATCSLVVSGKERMLINPSLPPQALAARLAERSPHKPSAITAVFATSLDPDHCRGISIFENARWFAAEVELLFARRRIAALRDQALHAADSTLLDRLQLEHEILDSVQPAPDNLAQGVDLFPLPGVSPGLTGLIISQPLSTILIAGDAVPTIEHLERAQVLPNCAHTAQAMESFREAIEIADIIIPGRDNILLNPARLRMS